MDKIPITKISKKIHNQKGFPTGPFNTCLICKCGDNQKGGACCELGVNVDKTSYDLIIKHKDELEKRLKIKIEKCFYKEWNDDNEFLGGSSVSTKVKNGTCIFRSTTGNGCELISLVLEKNLPKKMIPTACRIYPISWDEGELFLDYIRKNCVCIHKDNNCTQSIFETQKQELEDIFDFK